MDNKILIAIVAVALIAVAAVAVFTFSGDSEDVPSDAVRYKGNGGALESGAKYYDYKSTKVADCLFTKDGYHFVTWNTKSDGSGQEYKVGSAVPLKTILYAQWSDLNAIGSVNMYKNVFNLFVAEKGNEKLTNIDDASADIVPKNAILVLSAKDGSEISIEAPNKVIINDGTKTYTVILSIEVQGLSLGNPEKLGSTHPAVYFDINQSVKNQGATLSMRVTSS
jgi:hypothetical protein